MGTHYFVMEFLVNAETVWLIIACCGVSRMWLAGALENFAVCSDALVPRVWSQVLGSASD
jgi:hypothetical protein